MYSHNTTRCSLRGLPNLQRNTEWGEARSKAQSDFSRGGLRTLSRRGSGVRIPSPAPFSEPILVICNAISYPKISSGMHPLVTMAIRVHGSPRTAGYRSSSSVSARNRFNRLRTNRSCSLAYWVMYSLSCGYFSICSTYAAITSSISGMMPEHSGTTTSPISMSFPR